MAPSFDFASLLCTEDTSFFDENDFGGSMEVLEEPWQVEYDPPILDEPQQLDEPIGAVPPLLSEESVKVLVEKECCHVPASDYVSRLKIGDLDLEGRMEAIDWIHKVGMHFGFGPLCVYLAVNFMDRFLSAVDMLKDRMWSIQLLAVASLYLAAKIDETAVPRSLDMQMNEEKYLFDNKTILKMELMILSTLNWRMHSITPFSFIDYFLNKLTDDQVPTEDSFPKSFQLIMSTIRGLDFIHFKPSEIAAAVAVTISAEGENRTVETDKAVSLLTQYVDKERVMKCIEMFQQLESSSDTASAEDSLCLSNINAANATTSSSLANSSNNSNSPEAKRIKPNKTNEA
ncbi:cyclin-D4-2-like [Vicia villosa]|uniref:cyclin-D4-2-like n=1 Tax=Vicia villosa TaxID=3911 RepID=UPI00273C9987|nr:cyclin-D4-2-like [Vicia villosa]